MVMQSSIGVLSIFSEEKAVFIREHVNGYYGLPAYFFSKILVELPFQSLFPIIQSLIMYWVIGFATTPPYAVVVFMCTLILLSASGNALGIFFASLFPQLTIALAVTPMVLLPLMIFAGLLVNSGSIPAYFDWIKWLSPIKYGFEALIKNRKSIFVYVFT
jgi:ATP-binding cassette subfamily G (WHITE) protein 1